MSQRLCREALLDQSYSRHSWIDADLAEKDICAQFLISGLLGLQEDNDDEELGIGPTADGSKMQCLKCLMIFSHMSSAKRHYRNIHMHTETATCRFCKRVLKNVDSLNEHIRTYHGLLKRQLKSRIVPSPKQHSSL